MGNLEKAAAVLIERAENANPPLHLFLGQNVYDEAKTKMEAVQKDMKAVEQLATATAIDEAIAN